MCFTNTTIIVCEDRWHLQAVNISEFWSNTRLSHVTKILITDALSFCNNYSIVQNKLQVSAKFLD